MITKFQLIYKKKKTEEIDNQIKGFIRNNPNSSKDIVHFIRILESIFSENVLKIKELSIDVYNMHNKKKQEWLSKEDHKNLLNIIKKNICLNYDTWKNFFDTINDKYNQKGPNPSPLIYSFLYSISNMNPTYRLYSDYISERHKKNMLFISSNADQCRAYTIKARDKIKIHMLGPMLEAESNTLNKKTYKKAFMYVLDEVSDTPIDISQISNGSDIYSLKDLYELKSPKDMKTALIDYGMKLACDKKEFVVELINMLKTSNSSNQTINDLVRRHNLTDTEFRTLGSVLLHRKEIQKEIEVYDMCVSIGDILAMDDKKTFKDLNEMFFGIDNFLSNITETNDKETNMTLAFYLEKLLTNNCKMYFDNKQLTLDEQEECRDNFLKECHNMHIKFQNLEIDPSQIAYLDSETMDYLEVRKKVRKKTFLKSIFYWGGLILIIAIVVILGLCGFPIH